MCLILIAYKMHPEYPLILIANRDEFYDRPTAQAAYWSDKPEILGGRDLQAGGTWMGINKSGALAALTNYRSVDGPKKPDKSRGDLVVNYLKCQEITDIYVDYLSQIRGDYAGYNLLLGNIKRLMVYSNVNNKTYLITPGIHGLSNHFLNSDWFKVQKGKRELSDLIQNNDIGRKPLLNLLQSEERAQDLDLPNTGFTLEQERMLSPLFIKSTAYGTRCSTIITVNKNNEVSFYETSYGSKKQPESVEYQFQMLPG